jgi:hypothetical protein
VPIIPGDTRSRSTPSPARWPRSAAPARRSNHDRPVDADRGRRKRAHRPLQNAQTRFAQRPQGTLATENGTKGTFLMS